MYSYWVMSVCDAVLIIYDDYNIYMLNKNTLVFLKNALCAAI